LANSFFTLGVYSSFGNSENVGELAHIFIAMGISTIKAGIVTLMFMHLNYENKIVWGIVIYPLFIFTLILAGTLGDAAVKRSPQVFNPTVVESNADVAAEH